MEDENYQVGWNASSNKFIREVFTVTDNFMVRRKTKMDLPRLDCDMITLPSLCAHQFWPWRVLKAFFWYFLCEFRMEDEDYKVGWNASSNKFICEIFTVMDDFMVERLKWTCQDWIVIWSHYLVCVLRTHSHLQMRMSSVITLKGLSD